MANNITQAVVFILINILVLRKINCLSFDANVYIADYLQFQCPWQKADREYGRLPANFFLVALDFLMQSALQFPVDFLLNFLVKKSLVIVAKHLKNRPIFLIHSLKWLLARILFVRAND